MRKRPSEASFHSMLFLYYYNQNPCRALELLAKRQFSYAINVFLCFCLCNGHNKHFAEFTIFIAEFGFLVQKFCAEFSKIKSRKPSSLFNMTRLCTFPCCYYFVCYRYFVILFVILFIFCLLFYQYSISKLSKLMLVFGDLVICSFLIGYDMIFSFFKPF